SRDHPRPGRIDPGGPPARNSRTGLRLLARGDGPAPRAPRRVGRRPRRVRNRDRGRASRKRSDGRRLSRPSADVLARAPARESALGCNGESRERRRLWRQHRARAPPGRRHTGAHRGRGGCVPGRPGPRRAHACAPRPRPRGAGAARRAGPDCGSGSCRAPAGRPGEPCVSDLRRLLVLFRPHRSAALAAVLAMLGVAVFTGLLTYLFGPLFDQVLAPEARSAVMAHAGGAPGLGSVVGEKSVVRRTPVAKALDAGLASLEVALGVTPKTRVFVLPLLLFAAFLLKNLCAFVAEYRFNAVGLAFVRDFRKTLYEKILGQSGAFFARNPSGDLIARVTGDVDRIQSLFGTDLADLVQSLATLAVLVVVVVSLSQQLTLVALLITPAIVVPVVLIARRLRALSRAARERMGDLTGVLSETIRGARVVQAYGAEA